MMGIVHHANYVAYFEKGRLDYLRQRGLPYKEMIQRGLHMPVVEMHLHYMKPAHFDDLLRIETRFSGLSRVTVRFDYSIHQLGEGSDGAPQHLMDGQILLACVDDAGRPRGLPSDIVDTLFVPEASTRRASVSASDSLPDSRRSA